MNILKSPDLIFPDWPAPANIKAMISTRNGGVSAGAFASLNLGNHVGDAAEHVAENRRRFCAHLPQTPVWLRQVHGTKVVQAGDVFAADNPADAACTRLENTPCAVMVADCLPVLCCDREGSVVAAAHAGWRGLAAGVLQNTIAEMKVNPGEIIAYLGPAIGPDAFEVGSDVRDAFIAANSATDRAFVDIGEGKFLADIYQLAKIMLTNAGVTAIYGGEFCTVIERERFFSYRRDGVTGRMAAAVWIAQS